MYIHVYISIILDMYIHLITGKNKFIIKIGSHNLIGKKSHVNKASSLLEGYGVSKLIYIMPKKVILL